MKPNGNSSQYVPVPAQGEDDALPNGDKKDTKEIIGNDFNMAPLAMPEETREEITEKVVPMTPLRKFCFVLSILQCVLFIIAFGWLIPCKLPRFVNQTVPVLDWSVDFPFNEAITVTDVSPYDSTAVVILGFASSALNATSSIRALNIVDGSVRWHLPLPGEPFSLDCDNLDVDLDGIPDCIVGLSDHSAHMGAFNKSNRHIFWFVHSHQNSINIYSIGKPVVGVDCDDDRVKEVIFPFVDSAGSVYLATASGLTGQIRGTVKLNAICKNLPDSFATWNTTESKNIVFICNDGINSNLHSLFAHDLCENATDLDFGKLDSQTLERFDGKTTIVAKMLPVRSGGENLLTVTQTGRTILFAESRKVWEDNLRIDHSLRSIISGHFSSNSTGDILMVTGDPKGSSEIIVLNSTSGRLIHRFHFANLTIASALAFRKPVEESDGIILKVLESINSTDTNNSNDSQIQLLNEKYVFLDCFEFAENRTIVSNILFTRCKGDVCQPDVYTSTESASVVDVNGDGKHEFVFFHRTFSESEFADRDVVHLVRLDGAIQSQHCTTCNCPN